MKNKQYIPVKTIPKKNEEKTKSEKEKEKLENLYALAKKLNVKIGG